MITMITYEITRWRFGIIDRAGMLFNSLVSFVIHNDLWPLLYVFQTFITSRQIHIRIKFRHLAGGGGCFNIKIVFPVHIRPSKQMECTRASALTYRRLLFFLFYMGVKYRYVYMLVVHKNKGVSLLHETSWDWATLFPEENQTTKPSTYQLTETIVTGIIQQ